MQERQASTKQEQAILIAHMRSEGKTWAEIASTLRERYRINGRVALCLAHQLSQKDVADAWNARWPDDAKTFKNISYWERWPNSTGHQPSLPTLSRLAEIYECAVSDLVADYADYRHLDGASRKLLSRKAKLSPARASLTVRSEQSRKPDGVADVSPTATHGIRDLTAWVNGTNTSDDAIAQIEQASQYLAEIHKKIPARDVLSEVLSLHRQTQVPCRAESNGSANCASF